MEHPEVLAPGRRLVHFAAEECLVTQFRDRQDLSYTTADLKAREVDVNTDITDLVFGDASYDAIICSHVLEHIPDDDKAISELYRVLTPGGIALIQVPYLCDHLTDEDPTITDPSQRKKRWGQWDHVRCYGTDIVDRLARPGFTVTTIRLAQQMSEAEVAQFGLWDDVLFVCEKPGPVPSLD